MLVEKRFKKIFSFFALLLLASFFVLSRANAAGLTVGNSSQVLTMPHENLYYGVTSAANDKGNFLLFEKGYGNTVFKIDYAGNITTNGSLMGSNSYWNMSGSNLFASSTAWNVGIGTANPGTYKLYVNGNTNINGSLTATSLNGTYNGTIGAPNVSSGAFAANTGGGNFSFPGNVGIGVTSILARLHVVGLSTSPVALFNTNTGVNNFYVTRNNATAEAVNIGVNDTTAIFSSTQDENEAGNYGSILFRLGNFPNQLPNFQLSDYRNGSDQVRLHVDMENGNVGIGMTNPNDKLDVAGAIRFGTGSFTTGVGKLYTSATLGSVFTGNTGSTNDLSIANAAGQILIANPTGTNNTALNATIGNVGIGTTTPGAYKLYVNGNTNIAGNLNVTGSISGSGLTGMTVSAPNVSSGTFADNTGGGNFSFPGNVGIGTTNPTTKLDINGGIKASHALVQGTPDTTSGAIVYLRDTQATSTGTYFGGISFFSAPGTDYSIGKLTENGVSSLAFRNADNGLEYMRLTSAGNVGIGTTNPLARLHLSGTADNAMIIDERSWNNKAMIFFREGGSSAYGGHVGYSASPDGLQFNTLENNVEKLGIFIARSTGNVGIGTTTPGAYKLYVNGNTNIAGNLNVTGSISGSGLTGMTVSAPNVSSGTFAANTGGGNFSFPGNVDVAGNVTASSFIGYLNGNAKTAYGVYRNYLGNLGTIGDTKTAIVNQMSGNGGYSGSAVSVNGSTSLLAGNWSSDAAVVPASSNTTFIRLDNYGSATYGTWLVASYSDNDLYYIGRSSGEWTPWRKLWSDKNDGSSSGLDADLLDGHDTSYFQTALTNPVTGAGTDGYIPNWNGTGSVLENSPIFTNGTNVGIGTTTPGAYKLYVNGNTNIAGNLNVTGSISGSGLTGMTVSAPNVSSGTFAANTGGGNFSFPGKVGIGTTGASLNLQIQGTYGFPATSGTAQTNGKIRLSSSGTVGVLDIGSGSAAQGAWLQSTRSDDLSQNYALLLNPNGGNVGIGITNPSQKLEVNGIIKSPGMTSTWASTRVDSTNNKWYKIGVITLPNQYAMYEGTFISTFQGINTSAMPSVMFNIKALQGAMSSSPYVSIIQYSSTAGGADVKVIITHDDTSYKEISIYVGNVNQSYLYPYHSVINASTYASGSFLETVGDTGVLIGSLPAGTQVDMVKGITTLENGFVGIGTTAPVDKLHVNGSDNRSISMTAGGQDQRIVFRQSDNGNSNLPYAAVQGYLTSGSAGASGGYLSFLTAPGNPSALVERMRISESGNVGIGTTNPGAYKLYVNGNTYINGQITASGINGITVSAPNVSSGEFGVNTGGGNYIFGATVAGNVGIGTTTVNQKLSVTNNVSITNTSGQQYLLMGNQDSSGANKPSIISAANGGLYLGYGSSWIGNGGTLTSSMFLSPSGGVGIGTTNPGAYKLYVNGTTYLNNAATINGIATVNSGLELATGGTRSVSYYGSLANNYFTKMEQTATTGFGTYGPVSSDWALYNRFTGGATRGWIWQHGTTNVASLNGQGHMQIAGNLNSQGTGSNYFAGSVGIGTATPGAYKLNVNGDTNVTGNLNVTGQITATGINGITVSAPNVSSGAFAANTGGGNFTFPGNVGIGTTNPGTSNLYVNGSASVNGTLNILGNNHISMQESNFVNRRFEMVENANPQYILLCANAANNDVNGTIRMDRTSGLFQSSIVDVIISSGTGAMYGGTLRTLQFLNGNIRYELVTVTYSGVSYVAIKASGQAYFETSGAFFTGRLVDTSGSALTVVDSTGITAEAAFGGASQASFETTNFTVSGNVGIGTTDPGSYRLNVNGNTNVTGSVTWTGGNSSHLGTGANVTTYVGNSSVNNAIIRSNNNNNDAWLMNWGDSATYGIYNRNIDSALAVSGALTIPANSTAFIGGGLAKAYIDHATGNAGFAGTVTAGAFSGTYNGTIGAPNVSSGYFGQNTGGGEYHFPSNVYLDGDYGKSIVGLYSATRYQGVFAMGDAYKLAANGTTPGTLYGIAWTHSNVGGQSKAGLSHQALFMTNGVTQTAIGTGIWTLGGYTQSGGSSNVFTGITTVGNKTAITDSIANADSTSYSTFGVTREASSTALAYISMTRAGKTVKAMGIDSSNNWVFGNPTSGTQVIANPYLSINDSGYFGMSTAPNSSYRLDVNGTVRATSFSGAYSGTIGATNVSAGEFGSNTGGGNYIFGATVAGNVGIGTTSPSYKLDVAGSSEIIGYFHGTRTGSQGIRVQRDSGDTVDLKANYAGFGGGLVSSNALRFSVNGETTMINPAMYIETTGNVGIGTTNPETYKLYVNGTAKIAQELTMSGGAVIVGNLSMSTGKITANKLNVNTIDPLYSIGGTNYASFAASIVGGVKEEVMGKLKINNKVGSEYEAVIDFDKQEEGSDLWVWYKVIDFNKDNVEAIITPYGNFANTYYYVSGNSLIFRSDRPTEISYRLTAKRFDWRNWPTLPVDQTEKAGMIIK